MQFNEILSNEMNLRYEMEWNRSVLRDALKWNIRSEVKWEKYKWNDVEYDGMSWNKEDWYGIRENRLA